VAGGLKGQVSELPIAEVLQHLRLSRATGILSLISGGAPQGALRQGRPRGVRLQQPAQRPAGEILIREGKITVEEYEASIKAISKGKRQGKVLVEMGALSPKDLWEGVQFQVRRSSTASSSGTTASSTSRSRRCPRRSASPSTSTSWTSSWPGSAASTPTAASRAATRRRPRAGARGPERQSALEPYEDHVLQLVDGERSVLEICRESEIGDNETLKVLYALLSTGCAAKGKKVRALDQDFVPEDTLYSVLNSFNQMYGYIFRYMVREVGPIAENVLEKYLAACASAQGRASPASSSRRTARSTRAPRAQPQPLPEEQSAAAGRRPQRAALCGAAGREADAGADHEAAIIRAFRDR
jgi:hypothetical protein